MSSYSQLEFSLTKALLVFLGSGVGGVLRYGLGNLVFVLIRATFPLGTLLVNVTGCLAIGFLSVLWSDAGPVRDETRILILIGLLGGYTTFSSFGLETYVLAKNGEWWRASVYAVSSVSLSLIAVWAGTVLAIRLFTETSK
jgi:CrcB protein